jgi:heat shock protein HslJ
MTRLLALLLLAACAPTLAEPPPAADAWRLATLDGAPLGAPATLRFTPTGIAGDAPCNAYGAVVAQGPGGAFSPGAIETTERACDALGQEALFYEALGQVATRTETAGTLTLAGPRHVLVFTR